MRGRSLRLDPNEAHKVANNWDVICVARDHPKRDRRLRPHGAQAPQLFRHHRSRGNRVWGRAYRSKALSVRSRRLTMCSPRSTATSSNGARDGSASTHCGEWASRIGTYLPRLCGSVPSARSGCQPGGWTAPRPARRRHALSKLGQLLEQDWESARRSSAWPPARILLAIGLGGLMIAGGVGWAANSMRTYADRLGPSSSLDDLAAAVAEALVATGLVDSRLTAAAVRVATQPDGYYRCYLDGATLQDSGVFAACLDELLAPIESPRWIIPRYVSGPPRNFLGGLRLLAGRFAKDRVGATVVYHAVPAVLGANKARVQAFETAWNRRVSAGKALFQDDPRAQAIIQLQRGEDPFAVTTQMRTLWE